MLILSCHAWNAWKSRYRMQKSERQFSDNIQGKRMKKTNNVGVDCITKRCAVFFTQCIFHEDRRRKKAITRYFCSSVCHALLLLKKCNSLSTTTSFFAKDVFFERKSANKPYGHNIGGEQDKCVPVHFSMNIYSLKMRLREFRQTIKTNVLCKAKSMYFCASNMQMAMKF